MTRAFIKYVLALSLILFSGIGKIAANTLLPAPAVVHDVFQIQEDADLTVCRNAELICYNSTTSHLTKAHGIDAVEIEEEEDERFSTKKHITSGVPYTALFNALYLGVFQDFELTHASYNDEVPLTESLRPLYIAYSDYRL